MTVPKVVESHTLVLPNIPEPQISPFPERWGENPAAASATIPLIPASILAAATRSETLVPDLAPTAVKAKKRSVEAAIKKIFATSGLVSLLAQHTSNQSPQISKQVLAASSSDGGDPAERDVMYKILGVDSSASQTDIKRAYRRMALRLHPDKNPSDQEAKDRFQLLQKVMSILGDVEKREMYDRTGYIGVSPFVGESPQNFMELCKSVFKKVIEEDNNECRTRYKGSESEKKDLKVLYKMYEGDIDRLFPLMFFAEPDQDSHRFKDIIDYEISEGFLKMTEPYEKWAARISVKKAPNGPFAENRKKPEEYVGEKFSGRTFVMITDVLYDKYSKKYLGFLSASHSKNSLEVVECYARVYESKSHAQAYYNLMCRCSHDNILNATDYAENKDLAVITFEPIEELH